MDEEVLYLVAYTPKQVPIAIFSSENCIILDDHLKRHEKMLKTIIYDHWDEEKQPWSEWIDDFSIKAEASRYLWEVYESNGSSLEQSLEFICERSIVIP